MNEHAWFSAGAIIGLALGASFDSSAMAAPADSASVLSSKFRNDRGFFHVGYQRNEIGRGFDGQSVLTGGNVAVLLPKMDPGEGVGVSIGGKGAYLGGDFGYQRVKHGAEWLGARGAALFQAVDFGFRFYPLPGWPVEPYIRTGGGFKWLIVRDAASKAGEIGDAKYTDFGWDIGGGADIFLHRRILLEASVTQSSIEYGAVTAVKGDWSPIDVDIDAGGLQYRLALAYCFGAPR